MKCQRAFAMKPLWNLFFVMLCVAFAGCGASLPIEKASSQDAKPPKISSLTASSARGNYFLAVTKPPLVNDFPVAFRVKQPDTDARVRPVQTTTIGVSSDDTFTYATNK